jgi:hypothetical protein
LTRPNPSNVFPESSSAIAEILNRHFPTGSILDVNYGLGVFYKNVASRRIVGVDLKPTGTVIADNKALPFQNASFDVGVVDPPYKRGDGKRYEHRYGLAPKTETKVTWSYYAALEELLRVVRHGLIIKCQDGTDGHRVHARHFTLMTWMKEKTGLEPHDIAINARFSLPSMMAQGRSHFFQQGVSYFLIYRWTGCFKPVRF